jgi:Cu(I)/Ag(I) efflux system membrane fusion protein
MSHRETILLAAIIVAATLAGCSREAPTPAASQAAAERKPVYYRHPHNPAITSPVPRKDEMGMDFVPVYADAGPDGVALSSTAVNNLGVRTAVVKSGQLPDVFEAVGVVAYDERGLVQVRVRTEGYVESLAVRAAGERVARGQPLFAVYSPRLAAAQQEFAYARELGDETLLSASVSRLRALGLGAADIERLRAGGEPAARVTVTAPISGVVSELGIREGAMVTPDMMALTLVATDRVWIVAEIPEAQAGLVRAGTAATVTFASRPGESSAARVLEVLPELNPGTRTLRARLELANAGNGLKNGMLARVRLEGGHAKEAVLVPREAVIRTGRADRVIVARGGGRFEPRDVTVGRESDDELEILAGLAAGEVVVTSGQFMIDSESQVRSSLDRYKADGAAAPAGEPVVPAAPAGEHAGHDMPGDAAAPADGADAHAGHEEHSP